MNLRWRAVLFPLLSFAIPFVVYVRTAAPGVTSTDAGELAGVAATLGVAHPTGYPLFTLAGHAWLWAPIGGAPIHRLNLFAALCVALSAAVVFALTRLLLLALDAGDSPAGAGASGGFAPVNVAALATALTFAFARTIWQQATSVEVYSLHLLLAGLVLTMFARAALRTVPRRRDWLGLAFAVGLAFTNHLTTITLAPALLYLFFVKAGGLARALKLLALMAPAFLLGLSLYAYLPLRSAAAFPLASLGPPLFDWGGVGRGWSALWAHVTGRQFQYTMWSFRDVGLENLRRFLALAPYQLGHVGLLLVPLGVWRLRRRRTALVALSLLFAAPLIYACGYRIPDIDSYFLIPFGVLVWLAASGAYSLVHASGRLVWVLLVLPAATLAVSWTVCDRSRDFLVPDFVSNMAAAFDPGALVLSGEWEHFDSPFWYLQRVEHFRPDIALVNMHLLHRTWYGPQLARWYPELAASVAGELRELAAEETKFESNQPYDKDLTERRYLAVLTALVDRNIGRRPVYVTGTLVREEPDAIRNYNRAPAGFAWRLVPKDGPWPPVVDRFDLERLLASPVDPDDPDARLLVGSAVDGLTETLRYAQLRSAADVVPHLARLRRRLVDKLRTP